MGTDEGASRRVRKNRYSPEQVIEWRKSGLTKGEFAKRNKIHPNVFARWINRYEEEKQSSDFVRVKPHTLTSSRQSGIEIVLPDGIRIRCTSADEISEIVKLIRGQ